ncbi:MAG: VOC family protein [Solirubrobacterales bacterium]|nr:VOC family protein [Solirubrobacterales bacterium]
MGASQPKLVCTLGPMLHYVSIRVSDLERSAAFYDAMLGPMGWRRQTDDSEAIGWGLVTPVFFITNREAPHPGFGQVSFRANSIPAVKAAYEAGLESGGQSVAEPSSPPSRGPGSYAARLSDPDGYEVQLAVAPD